MQYALDAFANLLGALTFGFFATGAWIEGFRSLAIFEMRIGVYRFPLWPFKLIFAFGMTLLVIQLVVNVIKFIHRAMGHADYAKIKAGAPEKILMQV